MMSQQVSQDEWAEWLLNPTTRTFRTLLLKKREDYKEAWAQGTTISETEFGTKFLNGQAIGACKLIEDLLELDHNLVNKELNDEEPLRYPTPGPSDLG